MLVASKRQPGKVHVGAPRPLRTRTSTPLGQVLQWLFLFFCIISTNKMLSAMLLVVLGLP